MENYLTSLDKKLKVIGESFFSKNIFWKIILFPIYSLRVLFALITDLIERMWDKPLHSGMFIMLFIDFLYLAFGFLEIVGINDNSSSETLISFKPPKGDDLKVFSNLLEFLNSLLVGGFVFNEIKDSAIQAIVSISAMKTNTPVDKALQSIHYSENDKTKDNDN